MSYLSLPGALDAIGVLGAIGKAGADGAVIGPESKAAVNYCSRVGWARREIERQDPSEGWGQRYRWHLTPAGEARLRAEEATKRRE